MSASSWRAIRALALVAIVPGLTSVASAQTAPWPAHWEYQFLDSGAIDHPHPVPAVVWRQIVVVPAVCPWLRVFFARAELPEGSRIHLVSLRDGAEQWLSAQHVREWAGGSAYLNGFAVMVELEAGPNTRGNRIAIDRIWAGDDPASFVVSESICGGTDDRIPDSHPAIGRTDLGCTGWITDLPRNGSDKCHLSAGHCFPGSNVLEFYPPLSNANCALVHPHPDQQFAIDLTSMRSVNNGVGDDWAAFRCFRNSNTNLTTWETMGASIPLAATIPGVNTTVRVTGYGLDGSDTNGAPGGNGNCVCVPARGTGQRNQYQQTHTGPITVVAASSMSYRIDSCGGNSGSPVCLDGTSGLAVAIHTHGGCTATGGANSGTLVNHRGLQAGILAVCTGGGGGPLPNDLCSAPSPLSPGINGPFTNVGATTGGPAFACGNAGADVWFDFVPACTAPYTIQTCTATRNFATLLEVFGGTCAGPTSLGCNIGGCGAGSSLTLNLQQGQRVLLRVAGVGGAQGLFDLTVQPGTGLGVISRVATGCGGLDLQATGVPNLGSTITFRVVGATGIPHLSFGFSQRSQLVCPPSPCRLGTSGEIGLLGDNHLLVVPCTPSLIGVSVALQGADIFGSGGCTTMPLVLSDTLVITVG